MGPVLERLPQGARATIVRLRSLGDCVLTTPAIHLLKSSRPDLDVAVVVEDRFRAVYEGNPDVSAILAPSPPAVARRGAALCVNLHGGTRSAGLTAASRAGLRAGFAHFRMPAVYNVRIPRAQEILGEERPVHTAEHVASAMFYLGVPRQEIPRALLFAAPTRRARPFAVLHPFASQDDKTWPAERFVELARWLGRELDPVFISGPGDDASPFGEFEVVANQPLGSVMSLIGGASLFVGNDSGPAHIAAAYGIPVVALFGSSSPVTWAPWKTPARVLTATVGISGIALREAQDAVESLRVAA